ncbi:uncharacterized metallophosphoesterase CT_461 [Waddlia chondrophila 2032/99]|uniref:Uncharacterized metallophosphoesterase CT_461 n=1 Tax=Waddlia chondrophila 2032/99 TaxID=765953 RepID=F8LBA1_9BACT|nr:uncharacterized metallophosphoesterase CT_461 [Waddlia chondrophila 2032/99]
MAKSKKQHLSDRIWDLWCIGSVLGIWPRFIEPRLLKTTKLTLPIPNLSPALSGTKIVQFSDLHLSRKVPQNFLDKLVERINLLHPDILVFTGDFLCSCKMEDKERLVATLNRLKAVYGCFAIMGNHDYDQPVSINHEGVYDVDELRISMIKQGFKRLFSPQYPVGKVSKPVKQIPINPELLQTLEKTPFKVLNNHTEVLSINGKDLNVTGLGEYMLGRCLPEKAFSNYQVEAPGIVLSHNPDSIPLLEAFPGDLILSGHTHGAQVNLPWIWNHFTLMEQPQYKRGLFSLGKKWLYVNRGTGSVMPFRLFSTPEITEFTLKEN